MTRIQIIGAGVSGLCAGSYLQMNGFETEIFEKHSRPGGLCTSWKVGDYTFDGCIQWLLGSGPASPFYKLWSELIDMDQIEFVNHNVRLDIEVKNSADSQGNKVFHLYTDLSQMEQYLLRISPDDGVIIKKMIGLMRKIQSYEIPPLIETIPSQYSLKQKIGMVRNIPLLIFLLRYRKMTNYTLAKKFKSHFIREALQLIYDGDEFPWTLMMIPLAFADRHASGYPVGGSFLFVKKLEEKYLSLGGSIHYANGVKEILTEKNTAIGLELENGEKRFSDIILSTADWNFTVFKALKGQYTDKKILDLRNGKNLEVYYSIFSVFLGISLIFPDRPHLIRFPLDDDLVSPDGTTYSRMELHLYNYDPTLAPEGKTTANVTFYTRHGDFWIRMKKEDPEKYDRMKSEFSDRVIEVLEKRIPGIRKSIEVISTSTPATYYRYTNNWKGSVQGWLPGKNFLSSSPVGPVLPGLDNFYYSGHWSLPGGGLPVAIKTARDVVQIICKKYGRKFLNEPTHLNPRPLLLKEKGCRG